MGTINMAVGGGSHRATKLRIRAAIVGGKLAMPGIKNKIMTRMVPIRKSHLKQRAVEKEEKKTHRILSSYNNL